MRKDNVLLVEDDEFQQLVYKTCLPESIELLVASTIAEAETILHDNEVTFVILDYHLEGGENTISLAAKLRYLIVPYVVVTAEESPEVHADLSRNGAMFVWQKPINNKNIDTVIHTALATGKYIRHLRHNGIIDTAIGIIAGARSLTIQEARQALKRYVRSRAGSSEKGISSMTMLDASKLIIHETDSKSAFGVLQEIV